MSYQVSVPLPPAQTVPWDSDSDPDPRPWPPLATPAPLYPTRRGFATMASLRLLEEWAVLGWSMSQITARLAAYSIVVSPRAVADVCEWMRLGVVPKATPRALARTDCRPRRCQVCREPFRPSCPGFFRCLVCKAVARNAEDSVNVSLPRGLTFFHLGRDLTS